nr:MAG TPA: Protein of unknown function (DUF2655) [Caudoviricetes sp.]
MVTIYLIRHCCVCKESRAVLKLRTVLKYIIWELTTNNFITTRTKRSLTIIIIYTIY